MKRKPLDPRPEVIAEAMHRAGSADYQDWWAKVTDSGYCASPIRLATGSSLRPVEVFARCKNRRASVCPSCSQLYAGDTWQLVHAGMIGGPDDSASEGQPMVFATLTAPSFGPVHTAASRSANQSSQPCQPDRTASSCSHGRPTGCTELHRASESILGEPLCPDCYDYPSHVLFTWHAPELWHRFTIRLRRLVTRCGHGPDLKLAYVKVVELQRRGVPHFHAVIRVDHGTQTGTMNPVELAALVYQARAQVALGVTAQERRISLRFGEQLDVRPLDGPAGRAVAAYLAKYVTKSVGEFGLTARRLHEGVIDDLDLSDHVPADPPHHCRSRS